MIRNKADKLCRVIIEIDCLLDTRLGTIAKYSPDLANTILTDTENLYHERKTDDFPGISRETFYSLYQDRDIETMFNSRPTNIIKFLIKNHLELATNLRSQAKNETLVYQINVFPYLLTPVEQEDLILAFKHWLGIKEVIVECINFSTLDLTPKYIDSFVSCFFMYDYWTWLNLHAEALQKTRIPDVTLFCPEIMAGIGNNFEALVELANDGGPEPFTRLKLLISEYIEILHLSIDHFSIMNNLKLD